MTPKIEINGVTVSFKHRDVRLLNDREYRELVSFVEDEQRQDHGRLTKMVVENDGWLSERGGIARYVATTLHEEEDEG